MYVSIRAKATPDRTREVVSDNMAQIQKAVGPTVSPGVRSLGALRITSSSRTTHHTHLVLLADARAQFADHDLVANVRLETYVGDHFFHLPPKIDGN